MLSREVGPGLTGVFRWSEPSSCRSSAGADGRAGHPPLRRRTPQAALVGVAATDQAEIIFDTSASSRKFRHIQATPHVAVVIGFDDELTIQCEGPADILTGAERARCLSAYFDQYPDGRGRAEDADIPHVRIEPR